MATVKREEWSPVDSVDTPDSERSGASSKFKACRRLLRESDQVSTFPEDKQSSQGSLS